MTNAETILKLNEALTSLIKAYEELQGENGVLKQRVNELEDEVLNLELIKEDLEKSVNELKSNTEDDKKVLFQQGGRGEEAQKRNVNSTGYGLYITYKIIKDHQGHIKAISAGRDKGSTFEVKLPLV